MQITKLKCIHTNFKAIQSMTCTHYTSLHQRFLHTRTTMKHTLDEITCVKSRSQLRRIEVAVTSQRTLLMM